MMALLSEARAWREIARIIDTERCGAFDTVFLCLEADDLWYRERIDDATCEAMRDRVVWWNGDVGGAYSREDGTNQGIACTDARNRRSGTRSVATRTAPEDGGPRLQRSVICARSEHGRAENETQKPLAIVRPLVEHSCPPDGLVLSPFAGAGTDLVAAKILKRRAIGVELRESQCEVSAQRLSQGVLDFGGVA